MGAKGFRYLIQLRKIMVTISLEGGIGFAGAWSRRCFFCLRTVRCTIKLPL